MTKRERHLNDQLVRLFGWKASLFHGDPCVFDRWVWLRRHLQAGPLRTLDAGSGAGAYTFYAAGIGNDCVGLSFDTFSNEKARRRAGILGLGNIRVIDADLRQLDEHRSELGQFDQIICTETIEHISNGKKLVADLGSLLRPGGRLLMTTPYKYYRHLRGDRLSDYEDGGHVRWGYTHHELRDLLESAGLVAVEEDYLSGLISQQLTNLSRVLSRVSKRLAWLVTFPCRLLGIIDRPLTRLVNYPFLCIAVVATKPWARP